MNNKQTLIPYIHSCPYMNHYLISNVIRMPLPGNSFGRQSFLTTSVCGCQAMSSRSGHLYTPDFDSSKNLSFKSSSWTSRTYIKIDKHDLTLNAKMPNILIHFWSSLYVRKCDKLWYLNNNVMSHCLYCDYVIRYVAICDIFIFLLYI